MAESVVAKEQWGQKNQLFYARLGDVGHILSLLSAVVFALATAIRIRDPSDHWFDAEWKKYGFCVTNPDVPYLTSHDMAFYLDLVGATILAGAYFGLRHSSPTMHYPNQLMSTGIVGILAHGIGHASIAHAMRDGVLPTELDRYNIEFPKLRSRPWYYYLLNYVFFGGLLKASLPNVNNGIVALLTVVVRNAVLFVPIILGFTYVQTVLILAFSINQLLLPSAEKDFQYGLYSTLVGFPITLVGWMESTQCSVFVRDKLYGHAVYDGCIPFGMLIWYLVCYRHATTGSSVVTGASKTKAE